MIYRILYRKRRNVAPLAGAWIEMIYRILYRKRRNVAPLAGAWIEIFYNIGSNAPPIRVAPLAGAWIEISMYAYKYSLPLSLPSRERGLK